MNNYHLVPDGDRWKLTAEPNSNDIADFPTKEAALENAIGFLNKHPGSLKIHKADGTIEEERTYPRSADPHKSPG